ncbi:MAG: efflux RND transporter periplasmic adaptor subunit [PVC group bacterium]
MTTSSYKSPDRRHRIIRQTLPLIVVAALALTAGCSKKQPQQEIPPRPVKIAAAIEQDIPLYIENFGNLVSPDDVNIVSQVTGKILSVHFREGDEVKKGDPLFTIDPREYQADLDKSKASLEASRVDLKLKNETFERNKQLIGKKLISQQDYDTYQTDAEGARAQVALDQAAVELAEINLGYCSITSPINGATGKRLVDPGNVVAANSGTALVNIKSVDPLYVDFTIPESRFSWVKEEMAKSTLQVQISPEGDTGGPCDGTLQLIDNTVDPMTGTVSLRASVPNPDRKLWPGQYVTVRLIVASAPNAVLVPGAAVQLGPKGAYLFVVKDDNTAELRDDITVGLAEEDYVQIKKGVKVGEKVVTYGQLGLAPGSKVQIVADDSKKGGKEQTTPTSKKGEE